MSSLGYKDGGCSTRNSSVRPEIQTFDRKFERSTGNSKYHRNFRMTRFFEFWTFDRKFDVFISSNGRRTFEQTTRGFTCRQPKTYVKELNVKESGFQQMDRFSHPQGRKIPLRRKNSNSFTYARYNNKSIRERQVCKGICAGHVFKFLYVGTTPTLKKSFTWC